jgi:hypothetical protein
MELHEGLHGREKGSFLWFLQAEGEDICKSGLLCGWENMRSCKLIVVVLYLA